MIYSWPLAIVLYLNAEAVFHCVGVRARLTCETVRPGITCKMKIYWSRCGKSGMHVMQTGAVLYLSGFLLWIKAIFYLDEADSFISSSSVKLNIFKQDKIFHLHQLLLGDDWLFHKVLGRLQKRDVYYTIKVFSFEIRAVRLYLNKALIHAQTHSLIPLLNPTIGWDKDTLTI